MGQSLQGVAKRVAEVEQGARALLGFVGGDDPRLGGAAHRDGAAARRAAGEHRATIRLEPLEEVAIVDKAVFDHLRIAGAELA